MPPKQRITREELLEHAFTIAKEQGIQAVTSRSVAQSVGCSIRPVFCHFATMEELRQATFQYACNRLMQDIMKWQDEPDFLMRTNRWMLDLARNEKNLYELLYLSRSYQSDNLFEVMMEWDCNRRMIMVMGEKYHLTEAECKDIFQRGFYMLYGIATMIATNNMEITNEEAIAMVSRTVSQMVESVGCKNREES